MKTKEIAFSSHLSSSDLSLLWKLASSESALEKAHSLIQFSPSNPLLNMLYQPCSQEFGDKLISGKIMNVVAQHQDSTAHSISILVAGYGMLENVPCSQKYKKGIVRLIERKLREATLTPSDVYVIGTILSQQLFPSCASPEWEELSDTYKHSIYIPWKNLTEQLSMGSKIRSESDATLKEIVHTIFPDNSVSFNHFDIREGPDELGGSALLRRILNNDDEEEKKVITSDYLDISVKIDPSIGMQETEIIFSKLACSQRVASIDLKTTKEATLRLNRSFSIRDMIALEARLFGQLDSIFLKDTVVSNGKYIPFEEYNSKLTLKLMSHPFCNISPKYKDLCQDLLAGNGEQNKTVIISAHTEDTALCISHLNHIAEISAYGGAKIIRYDADSKRSSLPDKFYPLNVIYVSGSNITTESLASQTTPLLNDDTYRESVKIWLLDLPRGGNRDRMLQVLSYPTFGQYQLIEFEKIAASQARDLLNRYLVPSSIHIDTAELNNVCSSTIYCSFRDIDYSYKYITSSFKENDDITSKELSSFQSSLFRPKKSTQFDDLKTCQEIEDKYGKDILDQIKQFFSMIINHDFQVYGNLSVLVIYGASGTRKTTLGKMVGALAYELELTGKEQIYLVHGNELISEYIGQTSRTLTEKLESGIDQGFSTIMIDELYSLYNAGAGGANSKVSDATAKSGIDALLGFVEKRCSTEEKSPIILILAGYEKETREAIELNPGFARRISTKITLPSPSKEQLYTDFEKTVNDKSKHVSFTEGARRTVKEYLNRISEKTIERNGSYGLINNVINGMINHVLINNRNSVEEKDAVFVLEHLDTQFSEDIGSCQPIGFIT